MALTAGSRLGPYQIIAPLGAGGMGEVYRAHDSRLRRDVAIKVLPADVASSPERLARFEREATTVAGLNHPNIVTLHSIEESDGIRFLTMELVEGRSLAALVAPGGLPWLELLDLLVPLADALAAAHERGVVHRDLKPANVMVNRQGRVKVLDFGLAKAAMVEPDVDDTLAATRSTPLSHAGEVVGTVPYMAPEQVRGQAVDARTDLFSFGVLAYELASGTRPFVGATWADIGSAILRDAVPPLACLRVNVPADLERIIVRCLEKEPSERFANALEAANELRGLRHALERGEAPTAPRRAADPVASIAVLPFLNRSANADDEYFSDGLADELLNVLAKIRGLRVAARTSAFTFKGKAATIAEIGRALKVATVLEGSVRKAGTRVRISVQLVQVSDGDHLWSETYDRMLDDIFAVQDEIAQSVVKELRTALLGEAPDSRASGEVRAEISRAAKGRSAHPEAHRLYLRARYLMERITREGLAKAIEYLGQALALEPEFALAWTELGLAHMKQADLGWAPVEDGIGRARAAVERALALEPDLADAHAAIGLIQMTHDWNWRGAAASMKRALELAPGSALALRRAAIMAANHDRLDESIEFYRRAADLDPLGVAVHQNFGWTLAVSGRHTEAEAAYRKALEIAPQTIGTHAYLSWSLLALGRVDEALAEAAAEIHEPGRLWITAINAHLLGRATESDEALRLLVERYADDSACQIAEVHAVRGDVEAAFAWLDRASAQRDGGLSEAKVSPWLRSLHADPRWAAFLARMGFDG